MSDTEQQSLELLGYTREWLRLGVLSTVRLETQVEAMRDPDRDGHPEHYRWATFSDFLLNQSLSDSQLRDLLQLIALDEALRSPMLHALAKSQAISARQGEVLLSSAPADVTLRRVVERRQLLSQLQVAPSDELIRRAIDSKDSTVQRTMLESGRLTAACLEELATEGASRAVRNMAKQRLRAVRPHR